MSNADLVAAPSEVTMGGKTYRMSPLTIRDHMEFERWVQGRLAALAQSASKDSAEAKTLLAHAMSVSFYSRESRSARCSTDGLARLLWYGIRKNHAGVTMDEIVADATFEELGAANEAYIRLNYQGSDDPKREGAPATPPAP